MNDLIKRLVIETDVWCDQNVSDASWYNSAWERKFAELIVQECVNVINHRADTSTDYLDSKKANEHARQVQRDCATTLEYTFGLKEMHWSK